jgi:argininosuccinate synthase
MHLSQIPCGVFLNFLMTTLTVEANNLTRIYGGREAVSDVSFTLSKGEVLGFLGPNGAGKSTTMKMLTGNLAPSRGGVKICGIDMIENRLVGIKSREIYESPAMLVLIQAHRDLESLTLTADVSHYKRGIEETYTQIVYNGLWYSPLKTAIDAFIQKTQERVSGTVRLKLFKGNATTVGRWSDNSLYTPDLATYGAEDQFDHKAAEGFIYVWGLPTRIWAQQTRS